MTTEERPKKSSPSIESTDLVKLDGTIIKHDGTSYKTTFFDFLELYQDDYSDVTYTAEEARQIKRHLQNLSTGSSSAIPLICGGAARCPFAERCPFLRVDRERRAEDPDNFRSCVPIGKQCPEELNLLNEWTRLYTIEYQIEENSFTEFQMVRELAEIELMLWRLNNNLAKPERAALIQTVDVGVDREGNVLHREEASAFFEAKERLQNRKSRLVKLLVGDRQEKYKREASLKQRDMGDPSTQSAKLKQSIESQLLDLQKRARKLQEAVGSKDIVEAKIVSPEDIIEDEIETNPVQTGRDGPQSSEE